MIPTLVTPADVFPCDEELLAVLVDELNVQITASDRLRTQESVTFVLDMRIRPEYTLANGHCTATIGKGERVALAARLAKAGWMATVMNTGHPPVVEVIVRTDTSRF